MAFNNQIQNLQNYQNLVSQYSNAVSGARPRTAFVANQTRGVLNNIQTNVLNPLMQQQLTAQGNLNSLEQMNVMSPFTPMLSNVARQLFTTPMSAGRMQLYLPDTHPTKYDRYNGPPEDFDTFVTIFENTFLSSNGALPPAGNAAAAVPIPFLRVPYQLKQKTTLIACLGGKALRTYQNILVANPNPTYAEVVQALRDDSNAAYNARDVIADIMSMKQAVNEPVENYTYRFQALLSRQALPMPVQLNAYLQGLLPELAIEVLKTDPADLNAATATARRMEGILNKNKPVVDPRDVLLQTL